MRISKIAKSVATLIAVSALTSLGACNKDDEQQPAPEATMDNGLPDPNSGPASILRSDLSDEVVEEPTLEPLDTTISFGDGGTALTDEARNEIEELLETGQMKAGGPITLRGHTDSAGYDDANLRVSRRRAQSVADMLIENNIDSERIEIIALGETRPVAPNANLDGTSNDANRARNRRVDINISILEPADSEDPAAIPNSSNTKSESAGTVLAD